ncbi:hypothetical protein DKE52_013825 [Acinetobacter pittii]|uniref:Uncharacterized protein n=1 Tax=Acinetobacter pittii TaxID=48296 RepID=A0A3G6YLK3_ACIPI|nr:hypothetical protein DKE52_013825 [Acinetobacter pittii]
MFNLLLMGLSIIFGFLLILWLIFKFIILVVKNIYLKYIFFRIILNFTFNWGWLFYYKKNMNKER